MDWNEEFKCVTKEYENPINVIMSELQMQMENQIAKAVQNVGVVVDKEELIKALKYDRKQYDKGFADGEKNGLVEGVKMAWDSINKYARDIEYANYPMNFIQIAFDEVIEKIRGLNNG